MALGFPIDPPPNTGDRITLNGREWKYDGIKWVLVGLQITDVEFRQANPITVDQTFVGSTGPGDPGYLGIIEYGMDIKSLPLLSETDPNPSGTTTDDGTTNNDDLGSVVVIDPTPVISGGFNVVVVDTGVQNKYFINNSESPTLELVRGLSYEFVFNTTGHPFWVQYTDNANTYSDIDTYVLGMTGTAMEIGTMVWTVPTDAPDVLYYRCQFHSGMGGMITISNSTDTGTVTNPSPTTPSTPSTGY